MTQWIKNHSGVLLLLGIFLSLNLVFLWISPDSIVAYIGVENTYLTLFLIAAIGGLNSVTSGVLYASIVAFAAGGASPGLLGMAGGLGIAIGDSVLFYLFRYTSRSLSKQWKEKVLQAKKRVEKFPRWVQYLCLYLYLGFSPFPNDILMFLLAVLRFRFLLVLPAIVAGGITIALLTAFLGEQLPFI